MRCCAIIVATGLLCLSCGAVDTDDGHYPGMREVVGDGYHLHYADPPWMEAPASPPYGGYHPLLWVPAVYFGYELENLNAYLLQVDAVAGTATDVVATLLATGAVEGEVVDFPQRRFRTDAGDTGWEFGSHGGQLEARLPESAGHAVDDQTLTVRARRVVVDGSAGAFVILVVSVYDLDVPEMTAMLRTFEPRLPARDGGAPR
jgi:hypothetical protein